ncbi:hypothetical protein [Arthrobacter bambusae]|uniref:hypothetical protein n=1 Tax=Arthrobacter bambusae TaxID=1338426 RepID=UPI002781F6C2|nr:hypothetical protein [Arthrobacter bambusae]MDQ0211537.1 hypothetical protein [Arthrobacter bambusae]MDQ0235711.1 hypothetical protein [Arthrobacter bambusae]
MRTAPPSTDPATNRRRLIAAAIWAIAGLAIAASVAGIFLVARPSQARRRPPRPP